MDKKSNEKQAEAELTKDSVIVGDTSNRTIKRLFTPKIIATFALVTILVASVVTFGLLMHKSSSDNTSSSNSNSTATTDEKGNNFRPEVSSNDTSKGGDFSSVNSGTTISNTDANYIKYYGDAVTALESGDYNAAITAFEKAANAPGDKPSNFYAQMALTYKQLGNKAKAIETLQKAKDIYSSKESKGVSADINTATIQGFDIQIKELSQ